MASGLQDGTAGWNCRVELQMSCRLELQDELPEGPPGRDIRGRPGSRCTSTGMGSGATGCRAWRRQRRRAVSFAGDSVEALPVPDQWQQSADETRSRSM